ncbi:pulmonary surfactant-associated protein B [Numida meleagris]|uniref:pulmonary surfactant-associated protein B n=1 Tax=Numida meleagris TaxID=8996 RepID=UPI000B3DE3A3|nr:pulmonary surfactant-associated protein B [Numida meleagris]
MGTYGDIGDTGECGDRGGPLGTRRHSRVGRGDSTGALSQLGTRVPVVLALPHTPSLGGYKSAPCPALPAPPWHCHRCEHCSSSCSVPPQKPSAICARLELCPEQPGGVPAVPPHIGAHLQDEALPVPLPLCWLCRTFLSRAEAAVPKEAVATAVAQLCRALPVVAAGACQCLAERYTVLVLETVLGRLAPRLVCRLLLSCGPEEDGAAPASPPGDPGDTERVPLRAAGHRDPALWQVLSQLSPNLGLSPNPELPPKSGPCALGPAYWCSSAETARRCEVSRGEVTRDTGRWGDTSPTPAPRYQAVPYCRDHAGL